MNLRLIEFKKELSKNNSPGRSHILWFRGMILDLEGKPIDLRKILGPDVPKIFYKMCSGVTKRGRLDYTFNVKKG